MSRLVRIARSPLTLVRRQIKCPEMVNTQDTDSKKGNKVIIVDCHTKGYSIRRGDTQDAQGEILPRSKGGDQFLLLVSHPARCISGWDLFFYDVENPPPKPQKQETLDLPAVRQYRARERELVELISDAELTRQWALEIHDVEQAEDIAVFIERNRHELDGITKQLDIDLCGTRAKSLDPEITNKVKGVYKNIRRFIESFNDIDLKEVPEKLLNKVTTRDGDFHLLPHDLEWGFDTPIEAVVSLHVGLQKVFV